MYIRNCWYVVANPGELVEGRILSRTILDTPLALYRLGSGRIVAALDRCPHRFAPLSIGTIVGETLRCGYHGARFDADGLCVAVPGQERAPAKGCALTTFSVQERYGFIWVWLGTAVPEPLDTGPLATAFAPGGQASWHGGNGLFESLRANFNLVNDNLFDITHAEFVHSDSFGGPEARYYRRMQPGSDFVDGTMTYEMRERSIVVRMLARGLGDDCGPFFRWMVAAGLGEPDYAAAIDEELEIVWVAPSFIAFRGTSNPAADRGARFTGLNLHAVTPETATTSHYFYRALRDFSPGAEFTRGYLANVERIFEQDRRVLELQQERAGAELFEHALVSFAGDIVQLRARKIVNALYEAETGGTR